MAGEVYRFHCTDGHHAVLDRVGKRVWDPLLVWKHAETVALAIVNSTGGRIDWSAWFVDIHDQHGRHVGIMEFTDVRGIRSRRALADMKQAA